MSGSDNNLLQFIASTVETLRQRIDTMSEQMATKVDLANLKDYMEEKMATKEDLARLEASTNERFAQVDARFAQVDARFDSLDAKTTAIRGDIEQVHTWVSTRLIVE